MLINGIPTNQKLFAYDSDYKIYLLDDIDDVAEAVRLSNRGFMNIKKNSESLIPKKKQRLMLWRPASAVRF